MWGEVRRMFQKVKKEQALYALFLLLPFLLSAVCYSLYPLQTAVQWSGGEVTGTWPRAAAAFGIPALDGIAVLVLQVFAVNRLPQYSRLRTVCTWCLAALPALLQILILCLQ